jgi:hypothetical protein
MAAFATLVKVIEDYNLTALGVLIDTYLETLDSTNDPIASITVGCHPQTGKFWAVIVTT